VSFRCRKIAPCYLRPTTPSIRRCKSQGFPNLAERISQCRTRFLISLPNLLSADRQSHPKLQRRRVVSRVVLAEILGQVIEFPFVIVGMGSSLPSRDKSFSSGWQSHNTSRRTRKTLLGVTFIRNAISSTVGSPKMTYRTTNILSLPALGVRDHAATFSITSWRPGRSAIRGYRARGR
jgi:hypothetical protein